MLELLINILTHRNGRVSCMYYRPFLELAAASRDIALDSEQIAALDLFDACAKSDQLALRFSLARGETAILHNRSVLHARTDYEDWADAARRRHLLRVWIDAPERFPVDPAHELGDMFAASD